MHESPVNKLAFNPATLLPILIVLLAAFHLYCPPAQVAELEVDPDSVEYAVAGHRFATTGRYEIVVNGQALPPRYPPGFSVLFLAPVYAVAPGQIGNGIFAVWVAGILAALFAYLIGNKLTGPWGGALAAVFLLHHPQFAAYTQVIMTDVPAVALGLITCWLFLRIREEPRARTYLLAGCAIALSVTIRPLTGLLILPFLIDLAWNRRPRIGLRLLALGIPSALVIAGTSFQQWMAFGDWRRTGYQFWLAVPYDYFWLTFSRRYLRDNLRLFQWSLLWGPILLGMIGACALFRKRAPHAANTTFFLLAGVLPLSIIHLFYFFTDIRFHFLSLALFGALAAAGIAALIPERLRRRCWPALPMLALTLLVPRIGPHPLEQGDPIRYQVATAAAATLPQNALLISGVDPAYLEQLVARGTSRRILPLNRETPYAKILLAPVRIARLTPPPRNAADHACRGLLNGGARPLYPQTADEQIGRLTGQIEDGMPVFVELLSAPADHPSLAALREAFRFEPVSPEFPWLCRLHLKTTATHYRPSGADR